MHTGQVFAFDEHPMTIFDAVRRAGNSVQHWLIAAALVWASPAWADVDQKFDLLQVGTETYTNVTVTTKAPKYIFIMHSGGMANIKLSELSEETQEQLGYKVKKPSTNNVASWAKTKLAKIETPELKKLEETIIAQAPPQLVHNQPGQPLKLRLPSTTVLAAVGGGLLLVYLFFCYCCMLIVKKTGNEPGVLVWLPGLKMIPLFRAAGMSGWWFLALFVAQILWSIKIAQARGKSVWTGIMLLIPGLNLLAFLYLAFSNGGKDESKANSGRPQLMTLETA
jgi:hypothetical protein